MGYAKKLKDKILNGYKINKEEALKLYEEELNELLNSADDIRKFFCGDNVDLCSIINGKSGRCPEDCKYCGQSVHFKTEIEEYNLLPYESIMSILKNNEREGVNRFSIVTSGRGLKGKDFEKTISYYKRIRKESKISLCASHGIINKESLLKLKEIGIKRYHHNLETSRRYYKKICTTHSYNERIGTIKLAQEVGLEVCSGGIIGLGESILDRIDLAMELRKLNILSIPINLLVAIKGTPLESKKPLNEEEILRTIALFRYINPNAQIRLAAGRNLMKNNGERAFKCGANATITGNFLTTCGSDISQDIDMLTNLGFDFNK